MIPVGTLCVIVCEESLYNALGPIPFPSRICTVIQVPGNPTFDHSYAVCDVQFPNGETAGCTNWNSLRPITPPPIATDLQTTEPHEVTA